MWTFLEEIDNIIKKWFLFWKHLILWLTAKYFPLFLIPDYLAMQFFPPLCPIEINSTYLLEWLTNGSRVCPTTVPWTWTYFTWVNRTRGDSFCGLVKRLLRPTRPGTNQQVCEGLTPCRRSLQQKVYKETKSIC